MNNLNKVNLTFLRNLKDVQGLKDDQCTLHGNIPYSIILYNILYRKCVLFIFLIQGIMILCMINCVMGRDIKCSYAKPGNSNSRNVQKLILLYDKFQVVSVKLQFECNLEI